MLEPGNERDNRRGWAVRVTSVEVRLDDAGPHRPYNILVFSLSPGGSHQRVLMGEVTLAAL